MFFFYYFSITHLQARKNSEESNIEKEARERVAVMLHRCLGISTDNELSQTSTGTDPSDGIYVLIDMFYSLAYETITSIH